MARGYVRKRRLVRPMVMVLVLDGGTVFPSRSAVRRVHNAETKHNFHPILSGTNLEQPT